MSIDLPTPFSGGGGGGLSAAFSAPKPRHNNIQFGTGIDLYQHPEMANPKYAQSALMQNLIQQKQAQQQQAMMQQQAAQLIPNNVNRGPFGPGMSPPQMPMQMPPQAQLNKPVIGRSVEVPDLGMEAPAALNNNNMRSAILGGVQDRVIRNPKTLEYLKQYGVTPKATSSENDPKGYQQMAVKLLKH